MIERLKNKIEDLKNQKNNIEAEKAKVNAQIVELEKQAYELDIALLPIDSKLEVYYEVIDELAVIKAETESVEENASGEDKNYSFDVGQ